MLRYQGQAASGENESGRRTPPSPHPAPWTEPPATRPPPLPALVLPPHPETRGRKLRCHPQSADTAGRGPHHPYIAAQWGVLNQTLRNPGGRHLRPSGDIRHLQAASRVPCTSPRLSSPRTMYWGLPAGGTRPQSSDRSPWGCPSQVTHSRPCLAPGLMAATAAQGNSSPRMQARRQVWVQGCRGVGDAGYTPTPDPRSLGPLFPQLPRPSGFPNPNPGPQACCPRHSPG